MLKCPPWFPMTKFQFGLNVYSEILKNHFSQGNILYLTNISAELGKTKFTWNWMHPTFRPCVAQAKMTDKLTSHSQQ